MAIMASVRIMTVGSVNAVAFIALKMHMFTELLSSAGNQFIPDSFIRDDPVQDLFFNKGSEIPVYGRFIAGTIHLSFDFLFSHCISG